jgi:hypothetical protein
MICGGESAPASQLVRINAQVSDCELSYEMPWTALVDPTEVQLDPGHLRLALGSRRAIYRRPRLQHEHSLGFIEALKRPLQLRTIRFRRIG